MRDFLEIVARPEEAYQGSMANDLVCLSVPGLPVSAMRDPAFVANLPKGCRGEFSCIAEYLEWEASGSQFTRFKPARPEDRVYFIGAKDGPVKIGLTNNPSQRLEHLQTASPVKLRLLATVRAGRSLERAYHRHFDNTRLHGEWFNPTDDMRREIAFWNGQGWKLHRV